MVKDVPVFSDGAVDKPFGHLSDNRAQNRLPRWEAARQSGTEVIGQQFLAPVRSVKPVKMSCGFCSSAPRFGNFYG